MFKKIFKLAERASLRAEGILAAWWCQMADISLDKLIRNGGTATNRHLNVRPRVEGVWSCVWDPTEPPKHLPADVLCCAEGWPLRCLAEVGNQGCSGKSVTEIYSFLDQRESAGCQRDAEPLQTVELGTPELLSGARCLREAQVEMKFPCCLCSSPIIGSVTPAVMLTKTTQVPLQKATTPPHAHYAGMRINIINNHQAKQNLYDLNEDNDVAAPIPSKQMKFTVSGSFSTTWLGWVVTSFPCPMPSLWPKLFRMMHTQFLFFPPQLEQKPWPKFFGH